MYTHSRERRFFDVYKGEEGIVNNDLQAGPKHEYKRWTEVSTQVNEKVEHKKVGEYREMFKKRPRRFIYRI
jgi:hypothetical protein